MLGFYGKLQTPHLKQGSPSALVSIGYISNEKKISDAEEEEIPKIPNQSELPI